MTEIDNRVYIKVAGEDNNGIRSTLTDEEELALRQYLALIKDAGVRIVLVNRPADELRLSLDVHYDPLVLDAQGATLDGTNNEPIQDAIRNYLSQLTFDGELTLTALTDQLQQVPGVVIPVINTAHSRYGNVQDWTPINEVYQSDAGHLSIADDDLTIHYIPRHVPL